MSFFSRYFFKSKEIPVESSVSRTSPQVSKTVAPVPQTSAPVPNREGKASQEKARDWFEKGEKCLSNDDYDGAIAAYTSSINLQQIDNNAYYRRGIAYCRSLDNARALADFDIAISIDPENMGAYYVCGLIYLQEEQFDKSINSFDQVILKSISVDSNYNSLLDSAYEERGKAYRRKGENFKAIEDFDKSIAINPNKSKLYCERGEAYLGLEKFEMAIDDFSKSISLDRDDSYVYRMRGITYFNINETKKGLEDLQKACSLGDEPSCETLKRLWDKRDTKGEFTYYLDDLVKNNNICILPEIQNRNLYPFTMARAKSFFENFLRHTFDFDCEVKSILIYDGKENSPRHSYANGFLFSQCLDEIKKMKVMPKPIGKIYFECGGDISDPVIMVDKWEE